MEPFWFREDEVSRAIGIPDDLKDLGYKWCWTCNVIRPQRAAHCPCCDHCVLRFDHHCPFVNNCIGQRNYAFFIAFVSSVMCLLIMVMPLSLWWLLVASSGGVTQGLLVVSLVLGVLVGIAAIALLSLWGFHMFLIAVGRTTKEQLKASARVVAYEPTLLGPRGPSLIDPQLLVTVERQKHGKFKLAPKMETAVATLDPVTIVREP